MWWRRECISDKRSLCAADWGITTFSLIAQSAKGMWSVLIRRTLLPSQGCSVITVSPGRMTHCASPRFLLRGFCSLQKLCLQLHDGITIELFSIIRVIKLFSGIARASFGNVLTFCRLPLIHEICPIWFKNAVDPKSCYKVPGTVWHSE